MARRKRKEEEAVWTPPEFDEVAYMRKEIESAKIALVVIAWAAVGAVVAYLLYVYVIWVVGFLVGLAAFGALYFLLPVLGLPIEGFKRRDWLGNASVYCFSWLAFFILLLNPPFGDHTSPIVGSFQVGTFSASGTLPTAGSVACVAATPGTPVHVPSSSNRTLLILFRATDNVAIQSVQVTVNGANETATDVGDSANSCAGSSTSTFLPNTYAVTVPVTTNTWIVAVTALDTSGHSAAESITVQIP